MPFFRAMETTMPPTSHRTPYFNTLEEMRAARDAAIVRDDSPRPLYSPACVVARSDVMCPSPCVVPPPCAMPCVVSPPCAMPRVAPCLRSGNTRDRGVCVFFPYICNQNRTEIRDWCQVCTHHFLFPSQSHSFAPVHSSPSGARCARVATVRDVYGRCECVDIQSSSSALSEMTKEYTCTHSSWP